MLKLSGDGKRLFSLASRSGRSSRQSLNTLQVFESFLRSLPRPERFVLPEDVIKVENNVGQRRKPTTEENVFYLQLDMLVVTVLHLLKAEIFV